MIVVRDVFQLKFGRAREAVAVWEQGMEILRRIGARELRLLTDLTGPYYTLVLESTHESLAAFEASMKAETAVADWRGWYERFVPLVESGHREVFSVVHPGVPGLGKVDVRAAAAVPMTTT